MSGKLFGRSIRAAIVIMMASSAISSVTPALAEFSDLAETHTAQPIDDAQQIFAGSFAGAYLAGRAAENDNDLPAAIHFYWQAMGFDPDNAQIRQDLFLTLLSEGQFADAVPLAQQIDKDSAIAQFSRLTMAVDALSRKHYKQASDLLKSADTSDMDHLVTTMLNAWATYGAGNPNQALTLLTDVQRREWYHLFVTYQAALMADLAVNKKAAARYYQEALDDRLGGSAAPDTYERVVLAYASFLARNGERQAAIDLLNEAIEALAGRKTLASLKEKIERGDKIERLVPSVNAGAGEVLYTLGTAINRSGGEAFAKLYLNLSLPLRPGHDATLFQLGDISAKMSQADKAIGFYRQVDPVSVYAYDARTQLALNLADAGKTEEAVRELRKLISDNNSDTRSYLALGAVYAQQKDYRNAAEVYDEAVKLIETPSRQDWALFFQRGIAYERLKEWDKAEPNFKKALELYPDQPQVLNYLGYSWVDMGINLDEALDLIRKAVELRPQDGYIIDSLGWAYYKLGRYEDAVTELEKAVKLRPEDPTINDHLGDAYWQTGRKLEAVFQWNHAIAGKPEPDELPKIEAKLKDGLTEAEPENHSKNEAKPNEAVETPAAKKTDKDASEKLEKDPKID